MMNSSGSIRRRRRVLLVISLPVTKTDGHLSSTRGFSQIAVSLRKPTADSRQPTASQWKINFTSFGGVLL